MSSPEVLEVEAEPIEEGISPITGLDALIAGITGDAESIASEYLPHHIEDAEDFRQSKRERSAARRAIASLKGRYNDVMGDLKEAIRDADDRMRVALAPLDGIDRGYKDEIDGYTAAWEARRIEELRGFYEDLAPDLAIRQEGADREILPFSVLVNKYAKTDPKKWLLMGSKLADVETQIEGHVAEIAKAERSIDRAVAEQDRPDVKAHYFATLDLEGALAEASERAERRERMARLEEERRAREAEQAAAQAATEPEPEPEATHLVVGDGIVEVPIGDVPDPCEAYDDAMAAPEYDTPCPAPPVPAPEPATVQWASPAPEAAPMPAPMPETVPAPAPVEPAHPWVIVVPSMTRSQVLELRAWLNAWGITGGKVYAGTLAQAYMKEASNG